MKNDAISSHECSTIIRHLAITGKWKAHRMGATVEMARFKNETGGVVHYSVTIERRLVVSARAKTVAEAAAEVNAIIHGRPPVEMAGRAARNPAHTGTPALVRHRHGAPAGARLWEES